MVPNDQQPLYPPPQRSVITIRSSTNSPFICYTIMGITIAFFVMQGVSELMLGRDYVANLGMKVNELILAGELWRLFTPMFLHGSILHIGFNMYALYALGLGLERMYGHWRFLCLYLVAGFAGNVISFWFSPYPSLGASTAIFGLLGAEAVLLYRNRQLLGAGAQRALANIVMIAAINLVIGLSPGIDNWGHMGGLIGGTLFAWFGGPVFGVEGGYFTPVLSDTRENSDAVRAGIGVLAIFALLAAIKIYLGS